jgi:hypothetical protein
MTHFSLYGVPFHYLIIDCLLVHFFCSDIKNCTDRPSDMETFMGTGKRTSLFDYLLLGVERLSQSWETSRVIPEFVQLQFKLDIFYS